MIPLDEYPERPVKPSSRPRVRLVARIVAGLVAAGLVLGLAELSGTVAGSDAALVIMGFDPDRAQLITSLLVGAIGAAAACLLTDATAVSAIAGALAMAAMYAPTFVSETRSALASTGADGVFDPAGWALTLVTLVTIGLVVGWAAATIARPVRRRAIESGLMVRTAIRERRVGGRRIGKPLAAVLVIVLLGVTVPVFGQLVNFTPDSLMLHGAPPALGLGDAGAVPVGSPGPSPTLVPSPGATATDGPSAAPSARPFPTPGLISGPRPWLAWRPTGQGSLVTTLLPAPWVGGGTIPLTIYLPPGYGSTGRRYPVIYEAPTDFALWDGATNVATALDTMIDRGSMPASIMVFMGSNGSPYPDSECVNSFDGHEWMDTYFGVTVPAFIDAHYRTIASPTARSIVGMSQGGYCAALLQLHHPGVFGSEVSFSGYFQAGVAGANSRTPFGGDQALMTADSPSVIAPQLPAAVRTRSYCVLIADPAQSFYGGEAASFSSELGRIGYPHIELTTSIPHGWTQVRTETPLAFELVAQWEVTQGVFG